MDKTALIALFCAGGGVARYYLSMWVYSLLGRTFPYGTLAVNVIGAYLIGLIMEGALRSTILSDSLRLGVTVGLLGGLTTFSSFSYETFRLLEDGQFFLAMVNVLANVLICLFCTWLGIVTVRGLS